VVQESRFLYAGGIDVEDWQDWQKVYRFGTMVIWPPDDVREVVNRLREAHDPVSQSICEAHITLTQPLLQPLSDREWAEVTRIVGSFAPFEITYGPLNSFLPYPCIWYEIRPMEKVLEIRRALHETGFFNLALPHTEGFIPHMTITEGQSGPSVNEALLESLQSRVQSGSFWCSDVAYIVPDRTFHFEVARRLPLGPTPG
jgi:2'-5' RNA ligase